MKNDTITLEAIQARQDELVAMTDALRLAAKSAAPYGTAMIGASHLNEAADTIDNLRAQVAQITAERKMLPTSEAATNEEFAKSKFASAQDRDNMLLSTIERLRNERDALRKDEERLDWIIEHRAYVVSDPDCCDGYWLNYARPDGTLWTQATEHETPRAAIDAAKGPA